MNKVFIIGGNGIESLQPAQLAIHTIIYLAHSHGDREAVIFKQPDEHGLFTAVTIDDDEPKIYRIESYSIRPVSKKHGIGWYHDNEPKSCTDVEKIQQCINLAEEIEEQKREAQRARALEAEKTREAGKIIFEANKPAGAVAVIIADFMHDDSDSMTDYFSSHSTKSIILAFSDKKRDDFTEMRKACSGSEIEEIKIFADKTREGNTETYGDKTYYRDESREKYAGGSGYYLGNKYSGWRIRKRSISGWENDLYLISGKDGGFIAFKSEGTDKQPPVYEKQEVTAGQVQIIDYSEKAIAVIGDTYPIKETLKALGGKFNKFLSCGAGWIFSKTKLEEVQKALLSNVVKQVYTDGFDTAISQVKALNPANNTRESLQEITEMSEEEFREQHRENFIEKHKQGEE